MECVEDLFQTAQEFLLRLTAQPSGVLFLLGFGPNLSGLFVCSGPIGLSGRSRRNSGFEPLSDFSDILPSFSQAFQFDFVRES
jgi:hypothetical protein